MGESERVSVRAWGMPTSGMLASYSSFIWIHCLPHPASVPLLCWHPPPCSDVILLLFLSLPLSLSSSLSASLFLSLLDWHGHVSLLMCRHFKTSRVWHGRRLVERRLIEYVRPVHWLREPAFKGARPHRRTVSVKQLFHPGLRGAH